jgi:capsular exopolysaccharide synthesis family protein
VKTAEEQTSSSPGLPFDPITLLIGLVRRWKILVAALIISIILGAIAAYTLGSQTFESETILLYKAAPKKEEPGGRTPPVADRLQMILLPSNLRRVSETLQLGLEPKKLATAFVTRIEKKTSLIYITAQWNSAKMASALANTLRDQFLTSQIEYIKADAEKEIQDIEKRMKDVDRNLKEADSKLQQFLSDNKIVVDLGKEIQGTVDQISASELQVSASKNEEDTIETQRLNLQDRIDLLKANLIEEQAVTKKGKSLADLNIRIERLRRAIHDDKQFRQNRVDLEKNFLAYERAKELLGKGLISQQDFDKAKADYEAQEVKTNDTGEIEEWKRQLKVLEGEVIPPKEEFKSPTQDLLNNLQLKLLDMDLQKVSLKKKVEYTTDQIARLKSKLEVLTNLQRQQAILAKDVASWESQKNALEEQLTKERKDYESDDSGFIVVSAAPVPTQSIKSNKKIFFGALVFLGLVAGWVVVLALELLDTTIKSAGEVQSRFSLPVLGTIPSLKQTHGIFPDGSEFPLIEMFRMIALNVRREIPKRGARIMITSAGRWEGKTLTIANLAACFGRQDERTLVVDGQIRSVESEIDLRYMIAERDKPLKGLGEWLSFDVNDINEIIWPTVLPGVECIPHVEAAVTPDLLGAFRMKELMETLSEQFSLVLIDAPPVGDFVDTEILAQSCDAIIFIVRCRACVSSGLKKSVERMRKTGVPVVGFVINDVDQLYLKWA